ncbi:MAG: AI-2E family transporter [Halioglobus sp.]
MLEVFNKWYKRYLSEEESVLLIVMLVVAVVLLATIGDILTPIVASIVLAFLAQGLAGALANRGVPQWASVAVAYLVFIGVFFGVTLGLLPLVWRQLFSLISELPRMLELGQQNLDALAARYPEYLSRAQLGRLFTATQSELARLGQTILTRSLATIPGILTVLVYMILIPTLVFFFLKDRERILAWLGDFLPSERPLLKRIWGEMNVQFANYARGKALEILIVGIVTYSAFSWLGLNYAALLGLLVGLSVVVPYIGAALVTLPVLLVAFFQWGVGAEFFTVFAVYVIIQALDGNVLVPLLFSEAVNLHPVAIIIAVLFFGGIWGVWGVFFAIPLATLIKAIIDAWPRQDEEIASPEA